MLNCIFVFLYLLFFPSILFANLDLITWKGIYYQAVPNKKGVTRKYCNEHNPGTFIHTIKDGIDKPLITNKGIKLKQISFESNKVDRIYLIHGSLIASGTTAKNSWQDQIHYFLYKYSEAGITKGIWYSKQCKGLYKGIVLNNMNST
ncbi:hypothetical protein LEAN103870_18650 [Legionella anisa]|uniref:DUF3757 domain-containing protein n=1 Tax=Legionella anisa TaxID=28082 RepID=A0AAX0WV49_9GAMM|nr:hypothetical protein [Legionella anisa]AWN73595.1 hypothetical protein DLD14_06945 [Legionella anisa]KTC73948.1 hypothetical protein Lani_0792 [Legionella anisa]MBN5937507.1 hypothetical protein [Legionella anisa]MCW8426481.1 hypothetical protein [Legionella anisa]MCW8448144.1 hypothetical protein [Legionella anisa]